MTFARLSIALPIVLAVWAPVAVAYQTPDEVLTRTSMETSTVDPPSDDFQAEDWTVQDNNTDESLPSGIRPVRGDRSYRQQVSNNEHVTLTKYRSSSSESSEDIGATMDETSSAGPTDGAAGGAISLDAKSLRLLERLINRPHMAAPAISPAAHAGAPLSPTGPATVVAMATLLCAGAWTMKRARNRSAFSR